MRQREDLSDCPTREDPRELLACVIGLAQQPWPRTVKVEENSWNTHDCGECSIAHIHVLRNDLDRGRVLWRHTGTGLMQGIVKTGCARRFSAHLDDGAI